MDSTDRKTKKCSRCKNLFSKKFFAKDSSRPDGLRYWCNGCFKSYSDNYKKEYLKRPEVILRSKAASLKCEKTEKRKAWKRAYAKSPQRIAYLKSERFKEMARIRSRKYSQRPESKEKAWVREMFKAFNLTKDQYFSMFKKQKGKCGICKKHQRELKKRLAVDHCHDSGKIRGLLCALCNSTIGMLGDNKKSILKVIKYLERGV